MNQNQEKTSLERLIDAIAEDAGNFACTGLSGSEKAYLVSKLYMTRKAPVVVIVPSAKEAEACLEDLRFFLKKPAPPVIYFPSYNILPYKYLAYHSTTAARRIGSLFRLVVDEERPIVVTTALALLQKVIPKQELCNYAELMMVGEEIDRDQLAEKLVSGGYVRSAIAEEPGDFCIRGGILDVFCPLYPDPLRIEFFGDMVESLRFFSAANQRTLRRAEEAVILPAREAIVKKERLDRILGRIREQASKLNVPVTKVRSLIDRIKQESAFPGLESLIPLIYPFLSTFFDYTPEDSVFIITEPIETEKAVEQLIQQASTSFEAACNEARLCVEPDDLYLKWPEVKEILKQKSNLTVNRISISKGILNGEAVSGEFNFTVKDNAIVGMGLKRRRDKGLFRPVVTWINEQRKSGFLTLLVCSTPTQADRLRSLLIPYGIQLEVIESLPDAKQNRGKAYICLGRISSGFVWPAEFLAIITEEEIFGTKYRHRMKPEQQARTEFLSVEDLKKGDLVVHVEHGIGQYEGLVKLKLNGSSNDFILVIYKNNDKLYLPIDRMNMVQKYMGVDNVEPVLDKMGGTSWKRVKARVKKSAEKIAGELLKLYAVRKVSRGHAYGDVDVGFADFETGFPYEETTDQIRAIEDVLKDMKTQIPMDRLVCGDVGYGKTEVALRASFLAVNDAKQVAVLVPTTVLAEQHFSTFAERFDRYPINVACLSRFRSFQEQRSILGDLKSGKIDVVIGTHRLLQKDVVFKDLGLVVLDEEQRFGVVHKEKLKKIRRTVDVLALTATPIPRTLHMSMMGIRDISIISTPPEHRKSIITYISEFDDGIISEAIQNELNRGGQVFFVHNNIHSIGAMAKHLQQLVPGVKLDVAHGRLDEDTLEYVMFRFLNREIDMLVCTTIIESGLDIPSANTILINRADRFGLTQIYQLRGRVGRLDEQAYAYLLIPKESSLGKNAQKRLKTLMEHSDLGSGFQIAMSDLKIRGGGTILGASQSGHIAAVGYDMFLKLMEDSISELKGEPVPENLEPEINITMSAFIPESYIPDIDQRLSAYRRLARMTDIGDVKDLKEEIIDRYGAIPVEAENLFKKIKLRVLAIKAGVKRLDLVQQQLSLSFSETHQKNPGGIIDLIHSGTGQYRFTPDHVLKAKLTQSKTSGNIAQIKNILKEIKQRVNH
jgi:transcription-repair coupling factor (superfamily II helicase)